MNIDINEHNLTIDEIKVILVEQKNKPTRLHLWRRNKNNGYLSMTFVLHHYEFTLFSKDYAFDEIMNVIDESRNNCKLSIHNTGGFGQ